MAEITYPEHEKLQKVREKSQWLGEFLEDMQSKGIFLAERRTPVDSEYSSVFMVSKSINDLLADHLQIDLVKLEDEKQAMLKSIRETNAH